MRSLTDLGNGERLLDRYGEQLRYVAGWKSWLWWDGTRWRRDEVRKVEDLAHITARAILVEEARDAGSIEDRTKLAKHSLQSEGDHRIRAMLNRAGALPDLAIRSDELDANPSLFNVTNGTLDLERGELLKHRRENLITKIAPVAFDATARCPQWLAFLDKLMLGRQELVDYLQEAFGYTLTGDVREHVLFFAYGKGANGKTTMLDTMRDLMGDYGMVTDFSTFIQKKNDGPRNDIARLAGARMATAIEAAEGNRLAESVIKNLTGGDRIAARRLYEESFEFTPHFKIWLASNHLPVIKGTDLGIWRRVHMIPFEFTVKAEEKDLELKGKLVAEWAGILNWALAGLARWRSRGRLIAPAAVTAATSAYREFSDVLGQFLEERCELGANFSANFADLYESNKRWCEASGERSTSKKAFANALSERGLGQLKVNGHAPIRRAGVRLLGNNGDDQSPYTGISIARPPIGVHRNEDLLTPSFPDPSVIEPHSEREQRAIDEYERSEREAIKAESSAPLNALGGTTVGCQNQPARNRANGVL